MTAQPQPETTYRILVEPAGLRLRARVEGQVVADSADVLVMHETYRPSCTYFPKAGLIEGLLEPSDHRTFCPFKGTAHHWHLRLGDRLIENGAWSYETPLEEGVPVGGHVAFYPNLVEEEVVEGDRPAESTELVGAGPLIHWIMTRAWTCRTPAELTGQFAEQLVSIGMPLWRLNVGIWTLHPELAGRGFTWTRDQGEVTEADMPHGALQAPAYLNSPVRHVSEGLGGVRQRLDVDEPEFRFPVLDELRRGGGTDYVAMPLPFSDGQIHTMTLATDHPDGFSTAKLGQVFEAVFALARFYEVLALRRNAEVLFGTYLGERTGAKVLGGLTRRGDGEDIRAAVLFCDLRDSTALAAALPRQDYLDLLNAFFERVTGPIDARGGEVLKFIGDAVMAIFPLDGDAEDETTIAAACTRAREAAQEIMAQVVAIPRRAGAPAVQCAIGLHFGDVTYGNVGAPTRLDFTVTGPAANVAARLSDHCKALEHPLLLTSEIARHAPEGLQSLGRQRLHNVAEEVEVFAPSAGAFG